MGVVDALQGGFWLSLVLAGEWCKARGLASLLALVERGVPQIHAAFGAFSPRLKGIVLFPVSSGYSYGTHSLHCSPCQHPFIKNKL